MLMWLPLAAALLVGLGASRPLEAFTHERPSVELRTEDGRVVGDGPLFPDALLVPGEFAERHLVIRNSGKSAALTLGAVAEGESPVLLWHDLRITVTNLTTNEVRYSGSLAGLGAAADIIVPEGETRLALAVGLAPGSTPRLSSQGVTFLFTISGK